ncbi:hypothetical protein IHC92_20760 [Photobacterium damselae subsp. damselae]|uniref:hypothetical protein n=1 Tax=Photobacterium damselae TaxID=38293 RepID=UPI001F3DE343|nr:hypothetical protein [Photobacterium damselae]UKA23386.1 hypothetical protein IHC92_20760 [Photobacterium damselae subsp. damselae]
MDVITLPNAEVSIEINETNYTFKQSISIETNDPRVVRLLASPQNNSDGLVQIDNLEQSATFAFVVREVPRDLHNVIKKAWEKRMRIKASVIDLSNGRTLSARQAIISTNPINRTINGSANDQDIRLNLQVTPNNLKDTFRDL